MEWTNVNKDRLYISKNIAKFFEVSNIIWIDSVIFLEDIIIWNNDWNRIITKLPIRY